MLRATPAMGEMVAHAALVAHSLVKGRSDFVTTERQQVIEHMGRPRRMRKSEACKALTGIVVLGVA